MTDLLHRLGQIFGREFVMLEDLRPEEVAALVDMTVRHPESILDRDTLYAVRALSRTATTVEYAQAAFDALDVLMANVRYGMVALTEVRLTCVQGHESLWQRPTSLLEHEVWTTRPCFHFDRDGWVPGNVFDSSWMDRICGAPIVRAEFVRILTGAQADRERKR